MVAKRVVDILIIVSLFLCEIKARAYDYESIRSKPSGDLIVEVWLHKAHDNSHSFVTPIRYDCLTVTNKNCVVELPKDEYLCSIHMFDLAGNAIHLRSKYEEWGKRFNDLKYPSTEQLWNTSLRNILRMKPARITGPSGESLGIGPQMEADFIIAEQDGGSQKALPSIEDLFAVKEAGVYKVKLQFQVYARIYKGGQNFAYKLERFEPVEFMVVKEKKQ